MSVALNLNHFTHLCSSVCAASNLKESMDFLFRFGQWYMMEGKLQILFLLAGVFCSFSCIVLISTQAWNGWMSALPLTHVQMQILIHEALEPHAGNYFSYVGCKMGRCETHFFQLSVVSYALEWANQFATLPAFGEKLLCCSFIFF